MKRLIAIAMLTVMLMLCVFCANVSVSAETRYKGVFGKNLGYSDKSNYYEAQYSGGAYSVTTDSGVKITVTSSGSRVLVVHEIIRAEHEAYRWFRSCVDGNISFVPFDIYFLGTSGRTELSASDTVKISVSAGQSIVCLYSGGSKTTLASAQSSGTVSFRPTATAGYYLLCEVYADILGDADWDGKVTIMDATCIQRYLAHYDVKNTDHIILCGDVNGDGLGIMDATSIQRYLANYPVTYPIGQPM